MKTRVQFLMPTGFYFCWLLIGLTGCQRNGPKPDGSGTIECTQVQVAPEVGGRILKLPPREGAKLKKGDLVAELDPRDYGMKRDEVRAALATAQAQLNLLLAGAREEDIQRAREQVREAKAAAAAAQGDLQRVEKVYEQKSATQKQYDDAKTAVERTTAALAAADQNLARLLKGNRPEEIRVAEAAVEQVKVRLSQAEKAMADCTVLAPIAGVITVRSREEGEMVAPGAPLITISKLDEVWLSVYIPETRLGQVKLGQSGRVKIDGENKEFIGTVTFISPEAEFTPRNVQTPAERAKLVYRVKITLPNPAGIFKPGMPADGYLSP
jgi:HlyD family secretion protein